MKLLKGTAALLVAITAVSLVVLHLAGGGAFGRDVTAGEVEGQSVAPKLQAARDAAQATTAAALSEASAARAPASKQILFGDLHVHSSFSMDAFQLALPVSGGEGVHPVSDACDFARFCSNLDFFSINDHAASLTKRRWDETVASVRACNTVAGAGAEPALVPFLGWEWTQMGSSPENHYGHKNVVLRDLDDAHIPTRPISAEPPAGVPSTFETGRGGRLAMGLGAFLMSGGHDMMRALDELQGESRCPLGVPVRELPEACRESVGTPAELFAKLDEWGHASMVIPHGTTWGMYTPPGSSWAKQLTAEQHDPERQRLVEIYSGHGNTEEFRPWVAAEIAADGTRSCPPPSANYTPSCWAAGEIIRSRCLAENESEGACEARAVTARQHFVDADRNAGPWTVPGLVPHDFLEAGQCLDCFQPAFNFRPLGSVQHMLALSRPAATAADGTRPQRFRFGVIASSDNHTARAGTGYKEVARRHMSDARMAEIGRSSMVASFRRPVAARSEGFPLAERIPSVGFLETERSGSFYLSGGLAAVHTASRDRGDIWNALERRETYGTSGPRILLWFDLVDAKSGRSWPMGSAVARRSAPSFRVRAAGSFEQQPGCPAETEALLAPERLRFLCRGECYHPSDTRRPIDRIEVVRIRPQRSAREAVAPLIEDPWRVLSCDDSGEGCTVSFRDDEFAASGRDTAYYVRAIERASPVVDADPLWCRRDAEGACVEVDPCFDRPDDDDCLALSEQRAWSSPIFVDHAGDGGA